MGICAKPMRFIMTIQLNCAMLLITFILSASAHSQAVEFEPITYNITTEQGLPSLETYSVNQDSKGFVWITTDAGVCRYDGDRIEVFTTDDGLTDNVVFDSYEDYKGRIWFLTHNSLLCYYENGKIHKYKYNHKIKEIVKENIPLKQLLIDSNDNIYYSLKYVGMIKIDRYGNFFELHKADQSYFTKLVGIDKLLSFKLLKAKVHYKNGTYLLESFLFNGKTPKGKENSISYSFQYSLPRSIFNLNNNYAHFENCIYNIEKNQIIFRCDDLISFKVIDSVFWICTLKGLIKAELDSKGMLIQRNCYFPNLQFSSINKLDNCFIMTTIDNGVLFCEDFDFQKSNSALGLIDGSILSIAELRNQLIISNSLYVQNLNTGKTTNLGIDKRTSKRILVRNDTLLLFSSNINGYQNYRTSNDLKMKFREFGYSADFKLYDSVLYSVSDGIYEYNFKNNSKKLLYSAWHSPDNRQHRYLKACVKLPDGKLLVGDSNGLFELVNDKLISIDIDGLSLKITSLNYSESVGLVIGTSDNGVYIVKSDELIHINSANGLLSNKINTVTIDKNIIYVGTNKGLNVLNVKKGKIESLSYSCYKLFKNFDVNGIYIWNDWIYLGYSNGLVKLKKSKLLELKNAVKASVKLNEVEIDGEKRGEVSVIDFPYSANLLKIDFSVFQYSNWTGKKYQYRINENGEWIDIESPVISMYRPTGVLNFEVRYLNEDFSWSVPQKLCKVNVILPFWKSWYFLSIIVFFIFLSLFLMYERRQRKLHERLIYDNQLLSLEQQMQNARMNPHFIFNVLNSIHSYVLKEETAKADVYLMKFSKLMREILFSTKEGKIAVQHETSILTKYLELEQLRFNQSFDFEVIFREEMLGSMIPSMMIQPFVENAVLYSIQLENEPKMKITVHFEQLSISTLKVSISNSGIPTPEAQAKIKKVNTKNAIGITRKRLENYNKLFNSSDYGIELFVNDEKLTVIELKIPIVKK